MNNTNLIKNIINVALLVLVLMLIVLNIHAVRVNFLFFSLRIPLLLLIAGVFAIGWFTSKATGGVFDPTKIRKSIENAEKSVENVVKKGIDDAREIVDEVKSTPQKPTIRKTTRKTPIRKTPTKKGNTSQG